MTTATLFGIANCDTVKRARAWLQDQGVPFVFHDLRQQGLEAAALQRWAAACGWETLLNRRGTTWRRLDATAQSGVEDEASALRLMLQQPSLVKRPVVEWADGCITVGFDADGWASRVGSVRR